jgi:TolA-binding protein
VEHVERQEEREQELRAVADQLDERGDQMEERGDELGRKVENVREEFRRKQQAEDVPGAQEPNELAKEASPPPPEADITPGDRDE